MTAIVRKIVDDECGKASVGEKENSFGVVHEKYSHIMSDQCVNNVLKLVED